MFLLLSADPVEDFEHAFEWEEPLELCLDLLFGFSVLFFAVWELMLYDIADEISNEQFFEDEPVEDAIESEDDSEGASNGTQNSDKSDQVNLLLQNIEIALFKVVMEPTSNIIKEPNLILELIQMIVSLISWKLGLISVHLVLVKEVVIIVCEDVLLGHSERF